MKSKQYILQARDIKVCGRQVHYYEANSRSGEVVLFLHGFMSDATSIKDYIEQLGADKRLIAPDLPGFGLSEQLEGEVSLDDYVAWVEEFCQRLGIEPSVVVGYSFGAYVSVRYLLTLKNQRTRLVLICPVVNIQWQVRLYGHGFRLIALRNVALAEKLYRLQHDVTTLYVRRQRHPAVRKALLRRRRDELAYLRARLVLRLFADFLKFNFMSHAKDIKNPTVIITASRDNLASNRATAKFAAAIASTDLTYIDIKHAGHLLPIEEPYLLAVSTAAYISRPSNNR